MVTKKKTDETENPVETSAETTAPEIAEVEAGAVKTETADAAPNKAPARQAKESNAEGAGSSDSAKISRGKRAEKIGVVTSDKMTLTVVVRVDRLVKHPIYRKYVRKRKKFMAHDEQGAKIGDKVRIVETRPMSARKRWRVVEIIQKAEL